MSDMKKQQSKRVSPSDYMDKIEDSKIKNQKTQKDVTDEYIPKPKVKPTDKEKK